MEHAEVIFALGAVFGSVITGALAIAFNKQITDDWKAVTHALTEELVAEKSKALAFFDRVTGKVSEDAKVGAGKVLAEVKKEAPVLAEVAEVAAKAEAQTLAGAAGTAAVDAVAAEVKKVL